MKMKNILALAALATLAGCLVPSTDSEERIGEVGRASFGSAPNPIAVWTFDDCEGNTVPTKHGECCAATLYNGAICGQPGYSGAAAGIFDGVDDRAEIPYNSAFDFTTAMSVSAWVNPDDTNPPQTIVGKWYAPDSYLLWLSNGSYRFSVALAGGGRFSVAAPAAAGVFSQVTGVFTGADLEIYVNGVLRASTSAAGTLQASTRPVTIGNHPAWNPFSGAIDDVQLFDVDLTETQVSERYCAGCSGNQCCTF